MAAVSRAILWLGTLMVSRSGYRSLLGWVGVFCLAIFLGIGILAPRVLDAIQFFGILTFFGLPLAAVVLTTAAGFRHSKWWLVVAGLIVCLLLYVFDRLLQPGCSGAMFRAK